jgi:hypothetical protein
MTLKYPLKYPTTIDGSSDYMLFEFGEYKSSTQKGSSAYSTVQPFTSKGDKIAINMPSDVGTSFTGAWGGKNTTSLAQAALGIVAAPLGKIIVNGDVKGSLEEAFNGGKDKLTNLAKSVGDDAVRYLAESFSGLPGLGSNLGYNDVLQLAAGTILNPNTELLYGGNSLRTHSYTFKLIPQSQLEAKAVLDIVKTFREACLPKLKGAIFNTNGRNFISIPDICQVTFMQGDGRGENPYLPKYKPSGITSVNISYVTDGNYMSFSDGRPIGIQLTVSLTETKLVFRDDLEQGKAR